MPDGESSSTGVKSDETLLELIETLKEAETATPSTLADQLPVSKSTVHRHLTTLKRLGYVNQDGNRYALSLRFLDIGGKVRNRDASYKIVQPKVKELAEETGELAQFIVEENGEAVFIYREWAGNTVWTSARIGKRVPLHCTSAGKAILSALPETRVDDIIERHGLSKQTDATITDPTELKEELSTTRSRGYAYDLGEHTEGLRAVGAPIRGPDDEVLGAVSVASPTQKLKGERFEEEIPETLLRITNETELDVQYSRRI